MPDYRTFIDDYLKILDFIEWLKVAYPEKAKFLEGVDVESQSPYVNINLAMAKPNLDSAKRRYMASVENGKKGAEYGKLVGAPKDNQNARKKQPQKQPLDVDANENVDVNEDENDDIDVYDAADATLGEQVFSSSFSNSSNSVLINEENDSERLKKNEERKEPPTEEQPSHSNASVVGVASEGKSEIPLYSKDSSISSAPLGTGSIGEAGCSAARLSQGKDAGMDAGKYSTSHCIQKNRQPQLSDRRFCYHITQRIICFGVAF